MSKSLNKTFKRQLPLIDAVDVESTLWYALRMSPLGRYNEQTLENFIKSFTDTYVFVKEISKKDKEHYHCVINTKLEEFDLREKIRQFLKEQFKEPSKRGDANKQYNLSECIDSYESVIYILKDQDLDKNKIYYNNIDFEELKKLKKKSYKKYDSEEFGCKLKEIKDFIKEHPEIQLNNIMEKIVNLKVMYRQPINMNYIYQLSLSLRLNNHPDEIHVYVHNYLSRVL